jgi:hypothetical protein
LNNQYPVEKRYRDEIIDIREFIQPNTYVVNEIFKEIDNVDIEIFIQNAYNFVVEKIEYPFYTENTIRYLDRHYTETFLKPFDIKKIANTSLTSAVISITRSILTNQTVNLLGLSRDILIGNGIKALLGAFVNNDIIPENKYESLEFWAYPSETIRDGIGDCDDTSILLVSLLRKKINSDNVYFTAGFFNGFGHAWVTIKNIFPEDRILESTLERSLPFDVIDNQGQYVPVYEFNDKNFNIINDEIIENII